MYLVPTKKLPLPLPSVETATDNEIMITPALPIVLEPKGYIAYKIIYKFLSSNKQVDVYSFKIQIHICKLYMYVCGNIFIQYNVFKS